MTSLSHQVTSEIAYDLVRDHDETILALLEKPLSRDEVLGRVGSKSVLDRMLKYGLVTTDGERLRAVANAYHQLRQEGMMSFLERYVLPALTPGVDQADGFATLSTRYLRLPLDEARALRHGSVKELFEQITAISDRPADGMLSRLTVMVIGTSQIIPDELDAGEQALRHLKAAALQRSDPDQRDLGMLAQIYFLADKGRFSATTSAVESFLHEFDQERASSFAEATYHLTTAVHWRCATPGTQPSREQ